MRGRQAIPDWVTAAASGRLLHAEALIGGNWILLSAAEIREVSPEGSLWARPWHEVDHGDWDGEQHQLSITWVGEEAVTNVQTASQYPRTFPLVFREGVEASVVYSETETSPGGGVVKAAIRRGPGGRLLSQVFSVGTVYAGPTLDAQVGRLEARVREAVGMTT
ncbi:MAG: hypothetical protein ACK5KU_06480 [Beutenbergiaceae bacterium]